MLTLHNSTWAEHNMKWAGKTPVKLVLAAQGIYTSFKNLHVSHDLRLTL